MALNWPSKAPTELLDYELNWSQQLGTDTIASSSWTISAAALVNDHATYGSQIATIWLSGGTAGTAYSVNNTITTAGGRTYYQTVNISVQNK